MIIYRKIKKIFIKFFKKHDHILLKSSSLVSKDNNLLFTNAGMNQFKNIFLGIEKTELKRVVTIQRCLRVGGKNNDLKLIGHSNKHHTFFEMLGNFSFNDYDKTVAIKYAWDLLTNKQLFNLCYQKILVTVNNLDKESYKIWHNIIGLPKYQIIITNNYSYNFWQMDIVGPCGLSTEIYYDINNILTNNYDINNKNFYKNKFLELWNIVFIEFYKKHNDKNFYKLDKKFIDTGMGLERLSLVLQNVNSTYKIDILKKIKNIIKPYIIDKKLIFIYKNSLNIIIDHIRAIIFLFIDKIKPGNNKQNYVLKKLIRIVIFNKYFIFKIKNIYFLSNIFKKIKNILLYNHEDKYINLDMQEVEIILINEENKFLNLINKGYKILLKYIEIKNNKKILNYNNAFKLYDSFGLPKEIIIQICNNKGIILEKKK